MSGLLLRATQSCGGPCETTCDSHFRITYLEDGKAGVFVHQFSSLTYQGFPSWALTYPDFWVVLMILGSEVMSKGKTLEMESCLCAQDCLRLHMTHAEGTWDGT